MTNEEAIKYFKMRLAERTHPPTTAQQKAFTVALEALEKRTPKKIGWTEDCTWGMKKEVPVYPVCDCYLTMTHFFGEGDRITYCESCGQMLDWSE